MQNPGSPADVMQLLRRNAIGFADQPAVRIADQGMLTWAELDARARAVAGSLSGQVTVGDRVVLSFGTSLDFLPALFGSWYAGAVAVPVPPGKAAQAAARHTGAPVILVAEDVERAVAAGLTAEPVAVAYETALVQYTSGSTGAPKGVLVSHHNYMQNLRMVDEFTRSVAPGIEDLRAVSWLPVYHDMGLAVLMFTAFRGGTATVIPPQAFVGDPGVWLRTISEIGGNFSVAPNFAFDLCVRRVPAEEAARLDLGSLAIVLNGAEPVREDTLLRFADHFGPAGFKPHAFAPCYGLAEGTVLVSGLRYGGTPRTVRFHRESLRSGTAVEQPGAGRPLVSCGRRPEGLAVRIVDPVTSAEMPAGEMGEIWVHGPSVGRGYWQDEGSTAASFQARIDGFDEQPYLRTGDRGFLFEDELFVTGRLADLIQLDGWLFHPEDVEHTVERSVDLLHGRRCAVVPLGDKGDRLALVAEVRMPLPLDPGLRVQIEAMVRAAVGNEHGIEISEIELLPTGSIPVTTSGKVQRAKTRALLAANQRGDIR
ncbi:fatty acyl-AMP ligase [Actinoplanes palleronii]|uniref:AMP-dependent synthetase/ligase domain-containing protein n=1 Tax=Actinoplanes palleronii TaxID=113570 RepID=A0ABQ4B5G9_9ACTN|nr:fatty acyl-AMP ligase [Actinoplanes palleronii]GIE65917.1 hypothetical protein Apa02nite_020250 [Actinoplanes palleronii]